MPASAGVGDVDWAVVKKKCLETGKLFEDSAFPAVATSVKRAAGPADWIWKRPKDIKPSPRFIIEGCHFNLSHGEMADGWLTGALAVLTTYPELFKHVVPHGQRFDKEYTGMFHFRLWQFGNWQDVFIDDRLPVDEDGRPRFGLNLDQKTEFWCPLLVKAFAKLYGSYEDIFSGLAQNALVDLTGGVLESYNVHDRDNLPPDIWEIMLKADSAGAFMTTYIWGHEQGTLLEAKLHNGLFRGHIHRVSALMEHRVQGWPVKFIRLQNPWGKKEWTGPWSEGSDEWKTIPAEEKSKIGLVSQVDCDFWMSVDDWLNNFHLLHIVHINPEAIPDKQITLKCHVTEHYGSWIKGITAGGSGLLSAEKDIYYTNPQYRIILDDADSDDIAQQCTCIVSLTQRKRNHVTGSKKLAHSGFDVHHLKTKKNSNPVTQVDNIRQADNAVLKKQFRTKQASRDISCRLNLDPGHYCLVPNTMKTDEEAEFLLRICTYSPIAMIPMSTDNKTLISVKTQNSPTPATTSAPTEGAVDVGVFWSHADDDGMIDARDLRDILNVLFRKEMKDMGTLSLETCRSLIAMMDHRRAGVIGYPEIEKLWNTIVYWQKIFRKYDHDKAGCIETFELRSLLKELDIYIKLELIAEIAARYGGKERTIFFEDFLLLLSRIVSANDNFISLSRGAAQAVVDLEVWLSTTLHM